MATLETAESTPQAGLTEPQVRTEPRWNLAFIAILGYLVVEYMRLSAQYPIFQPVQIGKVVVAIAALGWLISPRPPRQGRSRIRALDIGLGFLLFGAFFSMLFSNYIGSAWGGYLDLLRWALIYFLIGRIVTSSWRFRIFVLVFVLLNFKMAQAGIRYYFHTLASWGSETVAVREGARAGSVGFFSNSADFGVAMCVVWPLTAMLLMMKPQKLFWRVLLLTASGVFLIAILVCGSRGAVVGAACVILAGIAVSKRKLGVVLMALLLVPGILFVMPGASKLRFRSAVDYRDDPTASSRLMFWRAGLLMFRDNPLLGVGIHNFAETRRDHYAYLGGTEVAWVPHSIYIEVLSELGLGGMIPTLTLIGLLFWLNAKTRKQMLTLGAEKRGSFEYCVASGLDLALVGYLTSGAFVAVFYYPHMWVLLGMSVGLHRATMRLHPQPAPQDAVSPDEAPQLRAVAS